MAYLIVKYQDPTMYALLDLSEDQMEMIARGLGELDEIYERLGAPDDRRQPIQDLVKVLNRRFGDDFEDD